MEKVKVIKELYDKNINQKIKQEAVVLVDELIYAAEYDSQSPARHKHGWLDNYGKNDWDKWKVILQDQDNSIWEATLHIANSKFGEKILYMILTK